MLDNYVRDFKALIDWIQLQEKLEKTDAQNRWSSVSTPHTFTLSLILIPSPFAIAPWGESGSAGVWSLALSHKQNGSITLALIQSDPWVYWLLFNTVTTATVNWLRNEIRSAASQFVHLKHTVNQ